MDNTPRQKQLSIRAALYSSPEEHLVHHPAHKEHGQHPHQPPQRAEGARRRPRVLHQAACPGRGARGWEGMGRALPSIGKATCVRAAAAAAGGGSGIFCRIRKSWAMSNPDSPNTAHAAPCMPRLLRHGAAPHSVRSRQLTLHDWVINEEAQRVAHCGGKKGGAEQRAKQQQFNYYSAHRSSFWLAV